MGVKERLTEFGNIAKNRWQKIKNGISTKSVAIGAGLSGLGKLVWNKLTNKNKLQPSAPSSPSHASASSINGMILVSLFYYLLIYFYLPFPSLIVRACFNLLFFLFFYYVLFDPSERNGNVFYHLLIIALYLELIIPWGIAKYQLGLSWFVYLFPWWLLYAIMIRGRDQTRLSRFSYFLGFLYFLAMLLLILTIILSIITGTFDLSNPGGSVTEVLITTQGKSGLLTSGPLGILFNVQDVEDSSGKEIALEVFKKTGTWWVDFFVLIKDSIVNVKSFTKNQINQATGAEYYTGQVEDNQNLPLGVIIEDVKAADTEFEQGETVTVYGTIKTRTLNEPVTIKANCYKGYTESKSTESSSTFRQGIIEPKSKFTVYDLDEEDIDCRFAEDHPALTTDLKSGGSFKVTIEATFNFETIAYLKSYFMDNERLKSMKRANIDPFKVFDINDKKPEAIFTPGPVKLGIGMKDPPIGVVIDGEDQQLFRVGVTVDNNLGWKGKIKKINQVVIYLPPGVEFDLTTCNVPFIPYTIQMCQQILNKDIIDQKETKAYKNCIEEKGSSQQGKQDCIVELCSQEFYTENKQNVKAYAVDTSQIGSILEDVKSYKTFSCRARVINPSELLGKTPISIRYVKSKVLYDYSVEKSTSVKVKVVPQASSETSQQKTITTIATTTTKTKILGYERVIPGDYEGYLISTQIPLSKLGTEISKLPEDHRLDQQKSIDLTGMFTYYDINNDNTADMLVVTEMETNFPYNSQQEYLLVQQNSKDYDLVIETFNQYFGKKADEIPGETKIVKK